MCLFFCQTIVRREKPIASTWLSLKVAASTASGGYNQRKASELDQLVCISKQAENVQMRLHNYNLGNNTDNVSAYFIWKRCGNKASSYANTGEWIRSQKCTQVRFRHPKMIFEFEGPCALSLQNIKCRTILLATCGCEECLGSGAGDW